MKLKSEMVLTRRGAGNHVLRGRTASAKALRQRRTWHTLGTGGRSTVSGKTVAKEGSKRQAGAV